MTGRRKLLKWMSLHGHTQVSFARQLGVTQSGLSRWLNGPTIPRWPHLRRIHNVTDGFVCPDDWLAEPEKGAVEP